jgi:hypothetical protein
LVAVPCNFTDISVSEEPTSSIFCPENEDVDSLILLYHEDRSSRFFRNPRDHNSTIKTEATGFSKCYNSFTVKTEIKRGYLPGYTASYPRGQ